jgi:hypothetical protein
VKPRAFALTLAALLLLPGRGSAHQAGLSYGSLTVAGPRLDLALRLSAAELFAVWPELAAPEELKKGVPDDLAGAVLGTVTVSQGSSNCTFAMGTSSLEPPDGVHLSGTFVCPEGGAPAQVRLGFIERMPPGHVHLAKVLRGSAVEDHVADRSHPSFEVEGFTPLSMQAVRFVRLGVEHIFTGFDHIAFLLGLLLAARALRDVIRVVTGFTVAHALTLALATTGVVAPPSSIVEPLIAASVLYIAVENLHEWRRGAVHPGRRWRIAFGFGLVHGFGFAGALRELHLPGGALALALVSFNVGVELGQAAIVAMAFPLLAQLRRLPRFVHAGLPAGSVGVGAAGLVWLVQRIRW